MGTFDRSALVAGLTAIAAQMERCKDELNQVDGSLGDGDLGITMTRGMASVTEELPNLPEDMGMALFACSKCFTRISGSSYGTLLATGLMAAAKQCKGSTTIAVSDVAELTGVALAAMQQRGKADLGDKTVLDSLAALNKGLAGIDESHELAQTAKTCAHVALDQLRDCESKQGRARMYGAKSKGMDDPGMLALTRVIESLAD